jgi:chaperonin GroEL
MELVKKAKKPLVVFSMDMQEEPLSTMVYNSKKNIVKCCAVNIPWAAGIELENLRDIAAMTGATVVDNLHMLSVRQVRMEHFGKANYIKINEHETSIVDGQGDPAHIEIRMD